MRYYNGPMSKLMDRLYDRMNEHAKWESSNVHLAREILKIEQEYESKIDELLKIIKEIEDDRG